MNSDTAINEVDEDAWSIYEKDIEEIVVDSNSEDAEDELSPKPLPKEREYERRKSINTMYTNIQQILGGGDADEPRIRILNKATDACKQLCLEELHLKYEAELLLQTNWKLKQRMEKLQKKKKRKTGPATISRRLSGSLISPTVKTSPIEKRSVSVDESNLVILPNIPAETTPSSTVVEESSKEPTPPPRNPKRKVKTRSGLSNEEKEFYKMEEKLEDLLYEIDALWNDVNNDEEKECNAEKAGEASQAKITPVVDDKTSSELLDPIKVPKRKDKIKLTDINKLIEPELYSNKINEEIKKNNLSMSTGESSIVKKIDVFKITNINKLLDPVQNPIIKSSNDLKYQNITDLHDKRRSSTSGDESPRLVIDENPPKNHFTQREKNVMESFGVDRLCFSLVSDEPTTSESQPMVIEMKKVSESIEKSEIIAISDSEDETDNPDVVCLE